MFEVIIINWCRNNFTIVPRQAPEKKCLSIGESKKAIKHLSKFGFGEFWKKLGNHNLRKDPLVINK